MCFGSATVSRSSGSVATVPVDSSLIESSTKMSERRFRRLKDNYTYTIAAGQVTFFTPNDRHSYPSNDYKTPTDLLAAVNDGKLEEIIPNAGSPEALANRLDAAQGATGFKLNDIITDRDSGSYGKVIGYGRVNLAGREAGERVLIVQLAHDVDGVDLAIIEPSNADFVAAAIL